MSSRSTSGMGGSKSKKSSAKSSSKPHEIHVRRGKSGGFIATHHHKAKPGEDQQPPDEHVLQDMDQLQQHMQDNMGDQASAGAPPQGGGQPQPQPTQQAAPPAGM